MDAWLEKRASKLALGDLLGAVEVYFVEENCKHRGWLAVTPSRIVWLEKSMGSLHIPSSKLVDPVYYPRQKYAGLKKRFLGGYVVGVGPHQYYGVPAADAGALDSLLSGAS
jgi:hypothetical protein